MQPGFTMPKNLVSANVFQGQKSAEVSIVESTDAALKFDYPENFHKTLAKWAIQSICDKCSQHLDQNLLIQLPRSTVCFASSTLKGTLKS
jgi:hypothetical protein